MAQRHPQIAVIDDDAPVREAIANLLEALGYSVTTFDSGQAFIESDMAEATTCVITDVQMPEMNGIELQRIVAERFSIPVIFITAFPHEAMRSKAMKQGAVAYLNKPVRQEALLDCLEKAIRAAA